MAGRGWPTEYGRCRASPAPVVQPRSAFPGWRSCRRPCARRVVAPVLEASQRRKENGQCIAMSDVSYDATHDRSFLPLALRGRSGSRPSLGRPAGEHRRRDQATDSGAAHTDIDFRQDELESFGDQLIMHEALAVAPSPERVPAQRDRPAILRRFQSGQLGRSGLEDSVDCQGFAPFGSAPAPARTTAAALLGETFQCVNSLRPRPAELFRPRTSVPTSDNNMAGRSATIRQTPESV